MMNFKIILIPENQIEVCIHRDCSEAGEEIVRITAFVSNAAGMEPILENVVRFCDKATAKSFVQDYSVNAARSFLIHALCDEGIKL
jgi:hypothetical protein